MSKDSKNDASDTVTTCAPPIDFDVLEKSVYAQGAEEAMLEQIFARVPPKNKYCLEFGASDGLRNSNTARFLLDKGWQGAFLEGSDYRFGRLESNWRDKSQVELLKAHITPDNVESLFAKVRAPKEFALLSIDIDGNDYWVWRAIEAYRPQVLVIEYNPYYEPPKRWVMKYNSEHEWDGSSYYGASLESLFHLGKAKGYELLCCDRQGNNAFFIEESSFPVFEIEDNRPEVLFRPAMYKPRFLGKNTFVTGHPYRYGPGDEI